MRSRLLWVPVSLALVAGALGAGWAVSQGAEQRSSIVSAFDALPAATLTVDYTSWSDIDGPLDVAGLAGLTTRSVVAQLDTEMRDVLGWSTSGLDWEVYGRIDGGAITALGLGKVSAGQAERSFAAIGSAVDGSEVYRLDEGAAFSSDFTSTFRWVRVVPGRDLVLAADDRPSLDAATAAVTGRDRSLLTVRALANIADRLDGVTSALLQSRSFLCRGAAIDPNDDATRRQLVTALASSGDLADPIWGARGIFAGDPQRIIFATAFDSAAVAREQVRVRQRLASGPFVGRTGQVDDSLRDLRAQESGGVVSLDFALTPTGEQFMTDTGRVIFAGCDPGQQVG